MKIVKMDGYLLVPDEDYNPAEESYINDNGGRHFHLEGADVLPEDEDELLGNPNCNLALCEKYFPEKPTEFGDILRPWPKPEEMYRHFKTGKIVHVIAVAQHTEYPGSYFVVYLCCDSENEGKVWIHPLDMFMSEVDHEKYPNATQKYRFEKVED